MALSGAMQAFLDDLAQNHPVAFKNFVTQNTALLGKLTKPGGPNMLDKGELEHIGSEMNRLTTKYQAGHEGSKAELDAAGDALTKKITTHATPFFGAPQDFSPEITSLGDVINYQPKQKAAAIQQEPPAPAITKAAPDAATAEKPAPAKVENTPPAAVAPDPENKKTDDDDDKDKGITADKTSNEGTAVLKNMFPELFAIIELISQLFAPKQQEQPAPASDFIPQAPLFTSPDKKTTAPAAAPAIEPENAPDKPGIDIKNVAQSLSGAGVSNPQSVVNASSLLRNGVAKAQTQIT